MNDNVQHPTHYTQGEIECIDCIKAATVNKTGIEAFCVGNAIKYLFRYENKNDLEDVHKAQWYINRLIQELEAKQKAKQTENLKAQILESKAREYMYKHTTTLPTPTITELKNNT